jgi:TP901 family phage tail tape measure protein
VGNQRSLTTYFKADSTSFKKGVDQMVQSLEKANKELVNNQYRQRDCNKVISDAQKEINKLKKEEKEKGQLDEKQKKQLEELNSTIESEKVKLAQLRTEQAAIKGTIGDLSKEIAGNNKEWTTLKATIANLASDGVELLARKLLELGKATIAVGEQFSSSMSEVGAISGASTEQLELLEQTARDYGATTKFSASESAQALKYMALAGWDTQQSIASLGSVLDLAAAGNMDLARASDIVTDYITAFGLSAEDSAHFVDVMAYAMAHSNTNVEQLGEAYKNCAASAASMGFSLEDVTAVLMTMANAGVKGGEAGTTINAIMTRLATDTKGCATELHNMGIEIFDENDNLKSLSEILQLVSSAFNGLSDKSDATLAKIIAGQNQYTGLQTILKGLSEQAELTGASFNDYSKALEECDGTSEGMAKTMSDNLSGDLKTMQSAFEELALKIYDSGETPLRELVQFVTEKGVPALENVINSLDEIIPVIVGAATAMTGLKAAMAISTIVGKLADALKNLTLAKIKETIQTKLATIATKELNAAQAANVIGVVVTAILSLVSALSTYAALTEQSADSTQRLNESQENYLKGLQEAQAAAKEKEQQTVADACALKSLESVYETLRNKVNLTTAEEAQLESVAKELSSTLGMTASQMKNEEGKYQSLTQSVDEYIEKLREQIKVEANKEGLTEAYKSYNAAAEGYSKSKKELDELIEKNKELENLRKAANGYKNGATDVSITKEDYDAFVAYDNKLQSLKQTVGEYEYQITKAAEAVGIYEEKMGSSTSALDRQYQLIDQAVQGISTATTEAGSAAGGAAEDLKKAAEDSKGAADDLGIAEDALTEYAENFFKGVEGYSMSGFAALFNLAGESVDDFKDRLSEANKALEDNRTDIRTAQEEMERLRKQLDPLSEDDENYASVSKQFEDAKQKVADLKAEQVNLKHAVSEAKKQYEAAAWASKSLNERLADITKTSSSLRSELSGLAGTFENLNSGQQLSLDALMQLSEKYPEYAADLLDAAGNTEKQKIAVEKLFEVKKKEYILSLTQARNEIDAGRQMIDTVKKQIEEQKKLLNQPGTAEKLKQLKERLAELNAEFVDGKSRVEAYDRAIAAMNNITLADWDGRSNNNNNRTETAAYTPAAVSDSAQQWTWGWLDETATGATSAEARMNLVERVAELGKITQRELRDEYRKILSEEQLTADESYNIRLKLKNMTDKLQQAEFDVRLKAMDDRKALGMETLADEVQQYKNMLRIEQMTAEQRLNIQKRLYDAEKQLRQQRLDAARAAYEKLTKDRTKTLEDANAKLKADSDAAVSAIDEEMKRHEQQRQDAERKKQLDEIQGRLDFDQLDRQTRRQLLRQKQDIINEQAEADYERSMEQKKLQIQEKANAEIDKNTEAIERLNSNLDVVANLLAKANGSQTVQQIVNNNSRNANVQLIQQGVTDDQLLKKIMDMLYSG